MKKLSRVILLSLVAIILAGMPVLAAVAYRAAYTIVESGGIPYDMLPTSVLVDNQWLADNGFIEADTLDTRIETLGGSVKPHMVATNKTLTAVPVPADSQTNLYFTTANTDLSATEIITGYDGYITITDDDTPAQETLELGDTFEIEIDDAYINTDVGGTKNLVYKEDAFKMYISAAESITAEVSMSRTYNPDADVEVDTVDGFVERFNVAGEDWDVTQGHTDGNVVDDAGNTITVGWGCDGNVDKFDDMYRGFLLFDTATISDGATITSATLKIFGTNKEDEAPWGDLTLNMYSANPAVNTALANEDYDQVGTTAFATPITYAAYNAAGWNTFTLNASGIAAIDKTGITKFGLREATYDTPDVEPSWNAADDAIFVFESVDNAGNLPVLTVGYSVAVTATGIDSGEYTVKTYGVVNEPAWATGDVLHFTGAADSNVNAGAINDNIAKLWVSLWFRLDSTFSAASATDQFVWGKFIDATHYVYAYLESDDGKLYYEFDDGGVNPFSLTSTIVSWTGGTWYHIITSLSDTVPAQRLLVNGTAEDTDTVVASNTPNGGDFCFGDFDDPGAVTGFIGEIQNVIVGTDDLSVAEEAALYAGTAPGDETNYWYIDGGTGTAIVDYGTGGNDGTADTACTWETATYTTGKTGRLCDFYIEVDDGVTDADRWGTNLKGTSVPANANDWLLNQNNVMPYMDYYKHTVSGVEHAWYQPNYMVAATDYDGTETAGGSAVTVTDNTMTDAPGYWVNALVTITSAGGAAPEGEARVCTVFAAGGVITVAPAFSANVDIGDTFTVDFGTLIDRSYYGMSFDGAVAADDDVIITDDASITDIFDGGGTIIAWINPASVGEAGAAHMSRKGNGWVIYVGVEVAGEIKIALQKTFDGGFGSWTTTATEITLNTWTMVAFTYNADDVANTAIIYVNGSPVGVNEVSPIGTTVSDTGSDMFIGNNATAGIRCFDGLIDEFSVYTRILDQAEITYNYNAGVGNYTPYSTTDLVAHWHTEEGSGTNLADSSAEGNTGTLEGGVAWVNGKVPRPAGNSGTNDSRVTWGVNPTGVGVTLGGMVSEGQPTPGALPSDPAQDILLETPVTDWFEEPVNVAGDITGGPLFTNPLRPFVTILSDNSTLTEIQSWRLLTLAIILMVTVATALAVGRHQGITMIVAGAAILGAVVLTIFPMWALVFAIGMFIGGLVMERSPSL